eukprot:TRINITY_DN66798_c0_g1_i1.p1 TRINITY_DN66798_c0_g1~~TRINITY_DN66798_c0_g1_i1.p1  ORF type:complete len:695 (+),score=41.90 TRINITY_DN66798_c0_g1_i1:299-2086(+)
MGSYEAPATFAWRPPSLPGQRSIWYRQCSPQEVRTFSSVTPQTHSAGIDLHETVRRLRRKFGDYSGRQWCKKGPDIVPLEQGSSYWLAMAANSQQVGVRVLDAEGAVAWEVSGEVVMTVSCKETTRALEMINVSVANPFAKPFAAPSQRPAIGWSLYFLFMQLYIFGAGPMNETSDQPPFWKLLFPLMVVFPFGTTFSNTIMGTAFFGGGHHLVSRAINAVVCGFTFSAALLVQPLPGHYLTDFFVCAGGSAALLIVGLPSCCLLTRSQGNIMTCLPWGLTVLGGTLGAWLIFYGVILLFLYASTSAPILSMILMPIATSATESGLVTLSTFMYTNWAYRKRLPGDQSMILSVLVCVLHGYAESSRLAATMVSAATTGDYMFFLGATVGVMVNAAHRLGWSRRCLCLLAHRLGFIKLRNLLCPSAVARVHDEAKFHFGYVRFITPMAIIGANIARQKPLLFNTPALACFIYTFVLEVLEDGIVHLQLLPCAPTPKMFDALYRSREVLHPQQMYVHTAASTEPGQPATTAHALQLHAMRPIDFMSIGMAIAPTSFFTMCLLQLYMGAGFMAGVCSSPISSEDRFSQAVLWKRPLEC